MEQGRHLGLIGPLHVQIRDILRSQISARRWRPGQPIPSETDLAREFGVSVGTMRKSIQGLELDGLVVRMQGRGTFVSTDPLATRGVSYSNLWLDGTRYLPVFEVIELQTLKAPEVVAHKLAVQPGETISRIKRRSITNAATIGEQVFVAGELRANGSSITFYDLAKPLRDLGIEIGKCREVVRPGVCDETWAADLALAPGTAVLHVDRLSTDHEENPVEYRRAAILPRAASYEAALS